MIIFNFIVGALALSVAFCVGAYLLSCDKESNKHSRSAHRHGSSAVGADDAEGRIDLPRMRRPSAETYAEQATEN